ncbi:pleiotropic drug resistance protein 3-like [Gossypium australe]|uniref:Pleiotropic drug resistance protein 3-like n=1 Tax=Gossypium australe TaxID=47621 RepID=A0A5B6X4A6_9ROSI|nr:pleiotropic drug resistance protein 3-like [Gossypium australe]
MVLPTKTVEKKTPFEAWYGFKPSVSHLKVFGCTCFVHVLEEKRSKLESRSQPGRFVGYSNVKKGYKIYNSFTKKVIISRDVKFDKKNLELDCSRVWDV